MQPVQHILLNSVNQNNIPTQAFAFSGEPKYVRIGNLDLNTKFGEGESQDFNIAENFRHPSNKPPLLYNDIGLIKLDRKAVLSADVRPACLETNKSLDLNKKSFTATNIASTANLEDVAVLKTTLEYLTHRECNNVYKNHKGIWLRHGIKNDSQICAVQHDKYSDLCQVSFKF